MTGSIMSSNVIGSSSSSGMSALGGDPGPCSKTTHSPKRTSAAPEKSREATDCLRLTLRRAHARMPVRGFVRAVKPTYLRDPGERRALRLEHAQLGRVLQRIGWLMGPPHARTHARTRTRTHARTHARTHSATHGATGRGHSAAGVVVTAAAAND
jgi:hypothetical protein